MFKHLLATALAACACVEDGASLRPAKLMHDRFGYKQVLALHGGMYDWEDAGYPMTKPKR
jgi:hypothetical protein